MKATIISIAGTAKGSIELPTVFATEYKPVLIKRAAQAIQTAQKQPKGTDQRAGKKNTAVYRGYRGVPTIHRIINTENARLPRMKNRRGLLYGRVAAVPQAPGGRAGHSLKQWETYREEINKKEKRLALQSAIAASIDKDLVAKRFIVEKDLPIIVEDAFEDIQKTKEALLALTNIGTGKDIASARDKVRKRAGRGGSRGRVWKEKKSVLVVTGKNSAILRAVRNLPGVDAVTANSLNVDLIAPGAEAGRLVVWTESAITELGKEKKTAIAGQSNADKRVAAKAAEAKGTAAPKKAKAPVAVAKTETTVAKEEKVAKAVKKTTAKKN